MHIAVDKLPSCNCSNPDQCGASGPAVWITAPDPGLYRCERNCIPHDAPQRMNAVRFNVGDEVMLKEELLIDSIDFLLPRSLPPGIVGNVDRVHCDGNPVVAVRFGPFGTYWVPVNDLYKDGKSVAYDALKKRGEGISKRSPRGGVSVETRTIRITVVDICMASGDTLDFLGRKFGLDRRGYIKFGHNGGTKLTGCRHSELDDDFRTRILAALGGNTP